MSGHAGTPFRILVELRPALEGYAGIPQETRLLFRGLAMLKGVRVAGLIQSGGHVLARGLPTAGAGQNPAVPTDQQLDQLGRVVISLEQAPREGYRDAAINVVGMAFRRLLGGTESLGVFHPEHFRDYLWRRFFARTLPPEDFDLVTSAGFRVAHLPWTGLHRIALHALRLIGRPLYPRFDTSDFDMMITETPYPATVSASTRLVVRYHDAIPLLMPHTIADRSYHQASHFQALRSNVDSGAWFVCVSEATRRDLLLVHPQIEARTLTIHNMVSHNYFDEDSRADRVMDIIRTRLNERIKPALDPQFKRHLFEDRPADEPLQYLLMVSTIEPRKNHLTLLSAWERLRVERFPQLKLVIVGATGWRHQPIVAKFRPWIERGDVFMISDVPSSDLRLLYKHARATVCPSYGEGFDFSGVEAMKSGGVVVASDIPVHREVYADAAEYFNPYSGGDLARAIQAVIDLPQAARREELVRTGAMVAQRYSYEAILPQWEAFLRRFTPPP